MLPPWLKCSAIVAAGVSVVAAIGLPAAAAAPGKTRPPAGWLASIQDVFVPDPPRGTDYEAVFRVQRAWGPPGEDVQVVRRQGDWLRIDKAADQRSASYIHLLTGSWATVARDAQGRYASVSIERPTPSPGADYRSFKTGERGQALGEPCEVWSVARQEPVAPKDRQLQRIGCVTADGIELWRRTDGLSSAEATKVTRRRFRADEVRPPRDLFDPRAWMDEASASNSAGDYEVVLAGARSGPRATIRSHAGWLYEDLPTLGGRQVRTRRADNAVVLGLYFSADEERRSLLFRKYPPAARGRIQPLGKSEIVSGERCDWFDVMPDVSDAGRTECRAQGGAPLKINLEARGAELSLTAVSVRRARLRMADVLPPKALLDPAFWGL